MELNCINASLPTLTINGEWSPWSKVKSDCVRLNETDHKDPRYTYPIKCGGGVRFLERSCTNPRPQVRLIYKGLFSPFVTCQSFIFLSKRGYSKRKL